MAEEYIPGTCNLGKVETNRRKVSATVYFLLTVATGIIIYNGNQPQYFRLFIALPAAAFFICIQQVLNRFCVAFGMMGIYNFKNKRKGNIEKVKEPEWIKKDRNKALQMIGLGILGGIITGVIFYFI
jgi:hypothetical protein